MRFRLDNLMAFLNVVETSSVSAAAERLKVSKSVVSKRISDLESELDVQLFHRTGHRLFPTENALVYSQRLCKIMGDLDQASELVSKDCGAIAGEVKIACPISLGGLCMSPSLITLAQRHPRLCVTLLLDHRIYDYKLSEGYDIAVRMGLPQGESLIVRKLAVSSRVVCCSPAYAERFGVPRTIDDLAKHSCLTYANVLPSKVWQFEPAARHGKVRSIPVQSRLVANTPEILRDGAIAGLGLAVLPMFVAAGPLEDGRLIDALPNHRPTSDVICAIRPPNGRLLARVRAVIDHLVAVFDARSGWNGGARSRVD
jgi:DNA-binding transcriptional LysR family regulator